MTTILGLYRGSMSLKVPGDRKLDPVDFKLTVGPETTSKFIKLSVFLYHAKHLVHFIQYCHSFNILASSGL